MSGMEADGIRYSVVILAWNGPDALDRCLNSLLGRLEASDTEVLVVANFDFHPDANLPRPVPRFRAVTQSNWRTVPELRKKALDLAHGEFVSFLEDHARCGTGWHRAIRRGHDQGYAIVGGAVENGAGQSMLNWAVYLSDYGPYMLPDVPRNRTALSGINVSYRASCLNGLLTAESERFLETFVNAELRERGFELHFLPDAVVFHENSYQFMPALMANYGYGLDYAEWRVSDAPTSRRIVLAATSLALPGLQVLRVMREVFTRRRHRSRFVACLPWLVALSIAWSLGECRGYASLRHGCP